MKTGGLEVGKMADFVIVNEDVRDVDPRDLTTLVVEQT